jgi:hypothetical protein
MERLSLIHLLVGSLVTWLVDTLIGLFYCYTRTSHSTVRFASIKPSIWCCALSAVRLQPQICLALFLSVLALQNITGPTTCSWDAAWTQLELIALLQSLISLGGISFSLSSPKYNYITSPPSLLPFTVPLFRHWCQGQTYSLYYTNLKSMGTSHRHA